MELGQQIKMRRNEQNITQEELANRLCVSRSAVSNWEIGRNYPDIETIILISDELDISLDDLLKGETKVVKQITEDTKKSKILSYRVKISYVIILLLIIVIGAILYKTNNYAEISESRQIKSANIVDDEIVITADLPIYRSLVEYYSDYTNDGEILNITLISKLDLTFNNNDSLSIAVPTDSENTKNVTVVNIVYKNKTIQSFDLSKSN